MAALKKTTQQYIGFRLEDWSTSPFGALCTKDMLPVFRDILSSTSREDVDQTLLDCALDAMKHGERISELLDSLKLIIYDKSYWPKVRNNAVRVYWQIISVDFTPIDSLLTFLTDVDQENIEDKEDEILGFLLSKLYPKYIHPEKIFDYLRSAKNDNLYGSYYFFWQSEFDKLTLDEHLPQLLDQLVEKRLELLELVTADSLSMIRISIKELIGRMLTRALVMHGNSITEQRLFNWLGIGLSKSEFSSIVDKEADQKINHWFQENPHRYKAVIEYSASLCVHKKDLRLCMSKSMARLYSSPQPIGIENWLLKKAETTKEKELAEFFFQRAVEILARKNNSPYLGMEELEFIES